MSAFSPISSETPTILPDMTDKTVRRRRLLATLGASLALAACGKKGELELPPPEPLSEPGPEAVIPAPENTDLPASDGGDGG